MRPFFLLLGFGAGMALLGCKTDATKSDAGPAPTTTDAGAMAAPAASAAPRVAASPAPACVDLPPLAPAVTGAAAARLADGRVLVAGGDDAAGKTISRAWFVDVAARTVVAAPPLPRPRTGDRAVRLGDGRVLLVGSSTQLPLGREPLLLFDPVHSAWSSVPTKHVMPIDASVTPLPDGRVLIAGGIVTDPSGRQQNFVDLALLFDPAKRTLVLAPPLPQAGVYVGQGVHDDHVELRGAADQSPGPGKMAVFDIAAGAWGLLDNGFPAPPVLAAGTYALDGGRLEIGAAAIRWCPAAP